MRRLPPRIFRRRHVGVASGVMATSDKLAYYDYLVRLNKAIDELRQLQREVEGLAAASVKDNRMKVVDDHLAEIQNIIAGTIALAVAHRG